MANGISRRTVLAAGAATAAAATAGPLAGLARAATPPTLPEGTSRDKVLIVGMDGLRHDRIEAAAAPALKSLMANGTYGTSLLYASPMAATSSGPGWSTISTGVWPDKHGVKDNSFAGKDYDTYPGLLARLARIRPELSTYAAVDWLPLDTQGTITAGADGKNVYDGDAEGYPQHDAHIADDTESVLREQNPDVCFVYFGNTDIVGHNSGADSPAYLDAIAVQDGYLGRLLAAIEARPTYPDENWTVIVATDHGHTGSGGHGGSSIEERRTFVLAQGPGIPAGGRPAGTRLVDAAATALHQLGIAPDPQWGLDGRPVQERGDDPFDGLYGQLQERADESGIPAGVLGFTHTPPGGWSVESGAMGTGGVTEWHGWAFATDEFWSRTQRDQSRELNVRARGVFAVADSDEWADADHTGTYDSTLVTPAYEVAGRSRAILAYTTLYLQEGAQTAEVLAAFDGGEPAVVERLTGDVLSQRRAVAVDVPAGAAEVTFRFRYTGDNNWYWTIDDVAVSTS